MKSKNIALLILIVSITLVLSYFLIKALFGTPSNESVVVEKVTKITADLEQPSSEVFNEDAINPTVVIQIGNPGNKQPFGD